MQCNKSILSLNQQYDNINKTCMHVVKIEKNNILIHCNMKFSRTITSPKRQKFIMESANNLEIRLTDTPVLVSNDYWGKAVNLKYKALKNRQF